MNRITRRLAAVSIAAMAAALAHGASAQTAAEAIHARVLKLDSHIDVLLNDGTDQASLDALKAGQINAATFAVFAGNGQMTPEGYAAGRARAMATLARIEAMAKDHPAEVERAYSAADVRRIVAAHKIAILTSFLDAWWLNGDVSGFDALYGQGVRVAGLAHAGNNAFADSSRPDYGTGELHHGLSDAGKAAVRRLNDLGVLVDVSQLTSKGVFQTLEISRVPVVATHSNAHALSDNVRNLSDAEIDAIAAKGGVIQVTPFNGYVINKPVGYDQKLLALRMEYGLGPGTGDAGMGKLPPDKRAVFYKTYKALYPAATIQQYVDHIDYIAKRVGVDHVGVGTDFNHGSGIPEFNSEAQAINVTRELVRRGYSEADIAKIWGGNFLRVLAQAEAARRP